MLPLPSIPFLPEIPDCAVGFHIRRVLPSERSRIGDWVRGEFTSGWADEFNVACSAQPPCAFVAVTPGGEPVGFACYNAAFKGFFGPVGVAENARGNGLGKTLTLTTLHAMREAGYAYAIIGWVSESAFYAKLLGAELIPDSEPGAYAGKVPQ